MPKKPEAPKSYYIPFQRYEDVPFVEEGFEDEEPFTARLRTNLTFAEVDELVWDADTNVREELWAMFAPHVLSWNLAMQAEDGTSAPIPAPAEAGPQQFQYIPIAMFWAIVREVKLRNTGKIDPKRKSRPVSTDATGDAAS